MLSLEELQKYNWTQFYECTTNIKTKRSGARVGRYLAVSGYDNQWTIYQVFGGLPVADFTVSSLQDAVKIAQFIDQHYKEYLAILEVYPRWNILQAAKLSIPHGETIYSAICALEQLDRKISYQDFVDQLHAIVQ
jgi:hypothetical protein